jgi:hypothetical protein
MGGDLVLNSHQAYFGEDGTNEKLVRVIVDMPEGVGGGSHNSYHLVLGWALSLTRGRVCRLSEQSAILDQLSVCVIIYILHVLHGTKYIYYNTSVSPGSVQQIMHLFLVAFATAVVSHLNGRMLDHCQV